MRATIFAATMTTAALLLTSCGGDSGDSDVDPTAQPSSSSEVTTGSPNPETDPAALDIALSEPDEDSVYPDVGDPSVDALHYDLDLEWDPSSDILTGTEVLTFRSTATADDFQLDFGVPLEIEALTLDGEEVGFDKVGKDLVVSASVTEDQRYELVIAYSGTPEPVDVPTTRADFSTTGFTITDEHETWTMQEPWGAYTWYAVNDQPSDKALYDFTLRVPSPWTGVANGQQLTSDDDGITRTTTYHLAEPAASYLITLAFGDFKKTDDVGPRGLPITYWTPTDGGDEFLGGLSTAPEAIEWLEQYLGPYPFDSAGILIVDSQSGMETQTMITLGATDYATEPSTIVHELAHQWYGDQVTPSDWRDVWMNEGMAMYLQLMWDADQAGTDIDTHLEGFADFEAQTRAEAGPPGNYDPTEFGSANIYFSGAFMWHELRQLLGDDEFFAIVRGWPQSQDNRSSDRETLLAYIEAESGRQFDDFWDAWLLSETTPPT